MDRSLSYHLSSKIFLLIISSLRATVNGLPPKQAIYRDYKHFSRENILPDLRHEIITDTFYQSKGHYTTFSAVFVFITDNPPNSYR